MRAILVAVKVVCAVLMAIIGAFLFGASIVDCDRPKAGVGIFLVAIGAGILMRHQETSA